MLVPGGATSGGVPLAWSPTGDRIAFDAGPADPASTELRIADVASGAVTSLIRAPGIRVTEFSPDGDRILYEVSSDTTAGATSAWSVRADGSDAQLLVAGTGWGDFDWQLLPAGP
jgi:Tol biopolymer transport system component